MAKTTNHAPPPSPDSWSDTFLAHLKSAVDAAGGVAGTAFERFYSGVGPAKAKGTMSAQQLKEHQKAKRAADKTMDKAAAKMRKATAKDKQRGSKDTPLPASSGKLAERFTNHADSFKVLAADFAAHGNAQARYLTQIAGARAGAVKTVALDTSRRSLALFGRALGRDDIQEHAPAGVAAFIVLVSVLLGWLYSRYAGNSKSTGANPGASAGSTGTAANANAELAADPVIAVEATADSRGDVPRASEGVKAPVGVEDSSSTPSLAIQEFATGAGGAVGGKEGSQEVNTSSSPPAEAASAANDSEVGVNAVADSAVGECVVSDSCKDNSNHASVNDDAASQGRGDSGWGGSVSIASDAATAGTDIDVDARAATMEEEENEEPEAGWSNDMATRVAATLGMDTRGLTADDVVTDLKAEMREGLGIVDENGVSEEADVSEGPGRNGEGPPGLPAYVGQQQRPGDAARVPLEVEASPAGELEGTADAGTSPTTAEKNEKKSFRSKKEKGKSPATPTTPTSDIPAMDTVDYEAGNTVASPFAASGGGPAASADESGAGSSFSPVPTLAGVESGLPKATSPFVAGGVSAAPAVSQVDDDAMEAPRTPVLAPALVTPPPPDRSRKEILKVAAVPTSAATAARDPSDATGTPEKGVPPIVGLGSAIIVPSALAAAADNSTRDTPPPTMAAVTESGIAAVATLNDHAQKPVDVDGIGEAIEGDIASSSEALQNAPEAANEAMTGTAGRKMGDVVEGGGEDVDGSTEGIEDKGAVASGTRAAVENIGSAVGGAADKMQSRSAPAPEVLKQTNQSPAETNPSDAQIAADQYVPTISARPALPAQPEQDQVQHGLNDVPAEAPSAPLAAPSLPEPDETTSVEAAESGAPALLNIEAAASAARALERAENTATEVNSALGADSGEVEVEEVDVVELHDEEERGPSSTGEWGGGGERVSWGSGASAASEEGYVPYGGSAVEPLYIPKGEAEISPVAISQLKKSGSSSSFFRRRKSSDETLRVPEDAKEGSTSGKHKFRKLINIKSFRHKKDTAK